MKNNYVLNHDFGYGREVEPKELNKISLRNFEDFKEYVENTLKSQFDMTNNIITIGKRKVKLILIKSE